MAAPRQPHNAEAAEALRHCERAGGGVFEREGGAPAEPPVPDPLFIRVKIGNDESKRDRKE